MVCGTNALRTRIAILAMACDIFALVSSQHIPSGMTDDWGFQFEEPSPGIAKVQIYFQDTKELEKKMLTLHSRLSSRQSTPDPDGSVSSKCKCFKLLLSTGGKDQEVNLTIARNKCREQKLRLANINEEQANRIVDFVNQQNFRASKQLYVALTYENTSIYDEDKRLVDFPNNTLVSDPRRNPSGPLSLLISDKGIKLRTQSPGDLIHGAICERSCESTKILIQDI